MAERTVDRRRRRDGWRCKRGGGTADIQRGFGMLSRLTIAMAALSFLSGLERAVASSPQARGENRGSQYLVAGRPTLAPFAFVKFCRANPTDCERANGPAIAALTTERARELRRINAEVNHAIRPAREAGDRDRWEADVAAGDCEDYVLTKRRKLIALGWSARALRIAIARTASGEGHAVLVVATSRGDLVLDNRTTAVRGWQRANLSWVKIQSGENPRLWHTL